MSFQPKSALESSRCCRKLFLNRCYTWTISSVRLNSTQSSAKTSIEEAYSGGTNQKAGSHRQLFRTFSLPYRPTLTSLTFQCSHKPGSLQKVITLFEKHDLNMRRIESKPSNTSESYQILVDLEVNPEDKSLKNLLADLEQNNSICKEVHLSDPKKVPWFPQRISDLDTFATNTIDAGVGLESDHPGFNDKTYRKRREDIVRNAGTYKFGQDIPLVKYTEEENKTWSAVYRRLKELYPRYACKEFNTILPLMEINCGYSENSIPQLDDISKYLQKCTGFRLRPVAGLLSARDFLNALAFRTFFSTQYIRHWSQPFYTPEPDVCHELLGHVPMFVDQNFADFSQTIGLASLGATDTDIKRLATCYWFSVEFGITKELKHEFSSSDAAAKLSYNDKDKYELKAYGAGLLSSFGELEYACGQKKAKMLKWDPSIAAETEYPITTFQPTYFVANGLEDGKKKMKKFCEDEISRPFHVKYDALTDSVHVDRNVKREIKKEEEF